MLQATVEPSLPEFDDSWLLDIDVTGFPEIRLQDETISEPQLDTDSYHENIDHSRQGGSRSRRSTLDQGQQPLSQGSYAPGKLFASDSWEVEPTIQSGINLPSPLNEEPFDFFATDFFLSEQTTVGSGSREPAKALVPPSCAKSRTRKRRRLSDSTREKVKSVRRAGACLRCRVYKEPVWNFLLCGDRRN